MKIIHCADLHLDSKMSTHLDKECARERKNEILNTFERMVRYAADNEVAAILIAGDLFDTNRISATARNTVFHNISEHPQIEFYYLKGNHDRDNFLSEIESIPGNLKLFDTQWTSYELAEGKVAISGMELNQGNSAASGLSLVLDANRFNIVMLHGQESQSTGKDKTEIINIRDYKNKGIDYLALGHIHGYKAECLDARGTYVYSGCLEGRGFDECGEHGFVLLDIDVDQRTYTYEMIPFAYRKLYELKVDVTDCAASSEMITKVREALSNHSYKSGSLIKIVLTGNLDVECEKNLSYIQKTFIDDFYFVKVVDETKLKVNISEYLYDYSLKGEFVRQVYEDHSISEEDKMTMIRYGLQAISGEEVE